MDILICGNRFCKIAPQLDDAADLVIDGSDKAVVPPFTIPTIMPQMSILRGYGDDKPLFEWLQEDIWPVEDKLTAEDIYTASRLAVLEMIRSGTVFLPICIFTARRRCGRLRKWGFARPYHWWRWTCSTPRRPRPKSGNRTVSGGAQPLSGTDYQRTFLSRGLHGFCRTAEICRRNRRAPLLVNADSFELKPRAKMPIAALNTAVRQPSASIPSAC